MTARCLACLQATNNSQLYDKSPIYCTWTYPITMCGHWGISDNSQSVSIFADLLPFVICTSWDLPTFWCCLASSFLFAFSPFPFHCALENGFARQLDCVICPCISVYVFSWYGILVLTNVSSDYLPYVLIDDMVCVWNVQILLVITHLHTITCIRCCSSADKIHILEEYRKIWHKSCTPQSYVVFQGDTIVFPPWS